MYCRNCGKELPEQTKFCMYCGTNLAGEGKKKKLDGYKLWTIFAVGAAVAAVVLLLGVVLSGGEDSGKAPAAPEKEAVMQETEATTKPTTEPTTEATTVPETELPAPENGWYEKDGKKYYNQNGIPVSGLQEIGGYTYYFDDAGVMQSNKTVDLGDTKIVLSRTGEIVQVCYEQIGGSWSDKSFKKDGYSASIRKLSFKVTNCTSAEFYVEAEGKRGANVSGKWKVFLRINGEWKHVESFTYKEPSGTLLLEFDTPVSFDAVAAYPTKTGNATYGVYYTIQNAWCNY